MDTTVWIDLLRAVQSPSVATLRRLLEEGSVVTTPVVVQEILQGASNPASLQRLREHFLSLPMVEPLPGGLTYAAAGELYARCRWQGLTPRSPHDCLIAQIAIDHGVALLHDDRDFTALARVDSRLLLLAADISWGNGLGFGPCHGSEPLPLPFARLTRPPSKTAAWGSRR